MSTTLLNQSNLSCMNSFLETHLHLLTIKYAASIESAYSKQQIGQNNIQKFDDNEYFLIIICIHNKHK